MPTKRPARPIRPIRPTPPTITRGGSKKTVVIMAVIVLAILAVLYHFLSRGPSGQNAPPSADTAAGSGQAGAAASGTAADGAGIAVGKARLQLESTGDKDTVRVVIDRPAGSEDSDVVYRYEWAINGKPAGEGSDSLSGFKRGERVAVKITPLQDGKAGPSRILDFLVQNTPPRVTGGQDIKLDGNVFSCHVKGIDSDGDALSYVLEDAPEGMTIDPQTGAIRWQLKESDYGERTIKVKVSDGKGGVANYSLKVDLQKPSPDKTSSDNRK